VVLDPLEQRATFETGLDVEILVERIDPEVVVVRAVTRGRRRSAVTRKWDR